MASGPITSWEIDGETVEIVSDFIFLGSKITADGDCSHEIKRHLLLVRRKVMTNLESIFKSRDITLLTKVRLVNIYLFLSALGLWFYAWAVSSCGGRGLWAPHGDGPCFWGVAATTTNRVDCKKQFHHIR